MASNNKGTKRVLGRGLDAILQSPDTDITSKDISGNYVAGAIADIPLSQIEANPFQPRTDFDKEALDELVLSIKEQGVIQPVTVRKMGFEKYQLIAGERRLKAAKIAGLETIPSFIRVANDEQMLEMALIENIHRQDLNAIEIAISYQRLMEECNLTQEKLSEKVGKGRATISNFLRLLKLPPEIQIAVRDGRINMGQARTLITIEDEELQLKILHNIIENELSVRQTEQLVKEFNNPKPSEKKREPKATLPEKYKAIPKQLSDKLGTKVNFKRNYKGEGNIIIKFKNDDELEKLIELLDK